LELASASLDWFLTPIPKGKFSALYLMKQTTF
jgi:hypothetical protein